MKTPFGKLLRWLLISGSIFLLLVLGAVVVCNGITNSAAHDHLYTDVNAIPHHKVGLILGTSKSTVHGYSNQYFKYRIDAALELYKAGKVDYFIVSGDNHVANYNEPRDMKEALVAQGIPDSIIYFDYAGFRTFDSVIRCKEIFGQTDITIISQRFHNQRAVYIARHFGVDADGFNAENVSAKAGFKTRLREYLARVKMILDIYILRTRPHFLGERIEIGS